MAADEKNTEGAEDAAAGAASPSPTKKPAAARVAAKPAAAEKTPAGAKKPAAAAKATAAAATKKSAAEKEPAGETEPAVTAEAPAKGVRARAGAKTSPTAAGGVEVAKPARTSAAAKKSAKPAAAPKRRPRPVGPVTVQAHARYVRSSARKARLVCNHIRGKSVPEARALLGFAPRGVASDWAKLLNSAVANAEHNHELVGDELHVKAAFADEGPTLKRFRTRAMGRATPILKRTSHLTIMLGPKE